MADLSPRTAPTRDPAWLPRLFWSSAFLVLLWPLLVATEFKPWRLLEAESLKVSGHFLASFWPLAHSGEFLLMVARETWRTVAMATAGITLALVSTLAGNLLLVGSIANLIVADLAQKCGVTLDWRSHARVGVPVTLLTLALVWLWMR